MEKTVVHVIKITRDDTLHVKEFCTHCGNVDSMHIVLSGVFCDGSRHHIQDWVEVHQQHLRLQPIDYLRDDYGRVLADLVDYQTGEKLTDYLIQCNAATRRPHHVTEVFDNAFRYMEPGDAVG